jgi:hypothetical protein
VIRAALVAGLVCVSTIAAEAAHPLSPTGAETALIGLLDVPLVYDGLETADAKAPTPPRIDIRDAPSATAPVVATVDREGLTTRDGTRCFWQREPQCRYHESGYEVPALAVFERRSVVATPATAWYRIAIERDGRRFGWMRSDAPYHDLASLVATSERLTYLTPAWDGRLFDQPGAARSRLAASAPTGRTERGYTALRSRIVGGRLWIEIEIQDLVCQGPNVVADKGWIPIRDTSGALLVWYRSRGC